MRDEDMLVFKGDIELPRTVEGNVVDITGDVNSIVEKSGILDGFVLVFVTGSTGAVTTIEYEPGLEQDIFDAFERFSPSSSRYKHDDMWHDGNGRSHVRASILGPDIMVPLADGKLSLGTWQQVVFLEMDNKPRDRSIVVHVMGAGDGGAG